ncbi:transcription factor Ken-like isoform X2 [Gigantopelta aegis]|uniref:transcription factor Ken-like isoform X2 n=1 Tax=Gigantopelta aegis TaxID=1735272 RepID=UPI001B88C422|nr:transcription factor Ken-like isoform X2 [Gigantopelta aegis]
MDKHYSEEFFFNFLEVLQKVCRDYLQFNDSVEVSGYLALDIDNTRKERYVLCELLNGAGHVVSESHCTKVFKTFHKKPLQTSSIENVVSGAPNGSESSVRNRNTDTDLNSVGELDSSEDFTNNNSVDPPHGSAVSVAGRRQTRSSRAVLGGTAQGLNCSPSSQQFTRDGDTSTMSLSSEKNNSKKKRGANTNLTSSAKKSKSAVGSECLNIVSDCSLLPQSYANTDSNEDGVSRSETPGFETDEHNEKICFPLTTTVTCKQEVMDDLDTLQLTCETISSESFVMDNNAQTFPDGAELVPCSSDSLPISDNKQMSRTISILQGKSSYSNDDRSMDRTPWASVDPDVTSLTYEQISRNLSECTATHASQNKGNQRRWENEKYISPVGQHSDRFVSQKVYRCNLCGYQTGLLPNLKRHERRHSGEFFRCHLCKCRFSDRYELSIHVRLHFEKLNCKVCGKTFSSRYGLQRHVKTHKHGRSLGIGGQQLVERL